MHDRIVHWFKLEDNELFFFKVKRVTTILKLLLNHHKAESLRHSWKLSSMPAEFLNKTHINNNKINMKEQKENSKMIIKMKTEK